MTDRYFLRFAFTLFLLIASLAPAPAAGDEVYAEVAKLMALDGRASADFGYSVSLDGDRLVVGAKRDGNVGAAYVLERTEDGGWTQVGKLVARVGNAHDTFGFSVAVDGDRVVVGAIGEDIGGAAYVFEMDGSGQWTQVRKLDPFGAGFNDLFGYSVAIDGDRLVVGANQYDGAATLSGAVFVFERDIQGVWQLSQRILAQDGQYADDFGVSVSLDGDRLVVGSRESDDNGLASGAAYLYERRPDGVWREVTKLLPLDGEAGDSFGDSVALDGDSLVIGAPWADPNGRESGSAYVFERNDAGSWLQVSHLVPSDGAAFDWFGRSVALDGDRLIVSSYLSDDRGDSSGSVYVYEREAGGSWTEVGKLLALDGQTGDRLGFSVSLDGDRLAVGAFGDDDNGDGSGSAYLFDTVLVAPQLTLSGECPGEILLTSSGTTPRSRFGVYGSSTEGVWEVDSGLCTGTLLGLSEADLLRLQNADFNGDGGLRREVDESWCSTYLQVLDARTCLSSEVVQIPPQTPDAQR